MARLFTSGFELNNLAAEFSLVSGAGATISTSNHTGTYALQATTAAATRQGIVQQFSLATANGPFFLRFYVNPSVAPGAQNLIACFSNGNAIGSTIQAGLRWNTDNSLQLVYNAAGTITAIGSNSAIMSGWNRVDLQISLAGGAGAHIVEARLNGTVFATASNLTVAAGALAFRLGTNMENTSVAAGTILFDDVGLNDSTGSFQTGYPGPGNVYSYVPVNTGDFNAFGAQTGGTAGAANNYTRVNEVNPDDVTSFNGSNIVNQQEMYKIQNPGLGTTDWVVVAEVHGRQRNQGAADATTAIKYQIEATSGGTIQQGAAIINNSTSWITDAPALNKPAGLVTYQDPTGADWNNTTLASWQAGMQITAVGVQRIDVTKLWVNLEWYTGTTKTLTQTATAKITQVPSVGTLSDDFNDNVRDSAKWNAVSVGSSSVTEAGQELHITPDKTVVGMSGYRSVNAYEIIGSRSFVQVTGMAGFSLVLETWLMMYIDSSNYFGWLNVNGNMIARTVRSGSSVDQFTVAYNNTNHRWWGVRESGGNLIFEASSDGLSWNTLATVASPFTDAQLHAVLLSLVAGTNATTGPSASTAQFDNFTGVVRVLTQPAKAAILGLVSKTQPAVANIGQSRTRTQTATASIYTGTPRYWVGGSATWDATAGTKWAATSGGAGGASVPTAANDVFFDANSGAAVITTSGLCLARSLICTGFTGTLVHTASTQIRLGDGTPGYANIALQLVPGMTYTLGAGSSSEFDFFSTSSTVQSIDFGGKTAGVVLMNGIGSQYQLVAAMTLSPLATFTFTNGNFDTNGQTCSLGFMSSSNTNVRTLSLGASSITLTGSSGVHWDMGAGSGLTLNTGTSTITMSHTSTMTFTGGSKTYYNLYINYLMGIGHTINGVNTFSNLSIIGVTGTSTSQAAPVFGSNQTITGLLTVTGFAQAARIVINSGTGGISRTITAAAVSLSNCDFMDIVAAGASIPWTGTSLGDAGGNANITFTTPVNHYRVGVAGSWNTNANWSLTPGGAGGATIPLCHDDVFVDANATGAIASNMFYIGRNVDFTGFVGTLNTGTQRNMFGSLTLSTGMTVGTSNSIVFRGRGTHTIDLKGKTYNGAITFAGPGGSYTMQSDLLATSADTLTFSSGTFDANNFNVNLASIISTVTTIARTVSMGNGTWTLQGSGSVVNITGGTLLTWNPQGSTVVIANTSAATKTISRFTGMLLNDMVIAGGTGLIQFSNATSSTLRNLSVTTPPVHITFNQPATYIFTGTVFPQGSAGNLVTIDSNNPGAAATMSKSSGLINADYLSLKDNAAGGGAGWFYGNNSTIVSGVSGWFAGVAVVNSLTQPAKAAILGIAAKTQPAVARFVATPTLTQPATARIAVTWSGQRQFGYVQSVQNNSGSSSTVLTLGAPAARGDLLVVHLKFLTIPSGVNVVDNVGNTYAQAMPAFSGAGSVGLQWYGVAVVGGATTITVSWTGNLSNRMTVDEFSGGFASNAAAFDKAASGAASGITGPYTSSVPISPARAGELISVALIPGSSYTAGTGYTLSPVSGGSQGSEYKLNGTLVEDGPVNMTGAGISFNEIVGAYFPGGQVQPARARIATNPTKTQTATARMIAAATKTQPAKAAIQGIATKTQPATAKLARNLSLTQTATANIYRNDIFYVGGAHAYPGSSLNIAVQAGDVIVVGASWNNSPVGQPAISDGVNGYTVRADQQASANFTRVTVWTAIAATTTTLTISVTGGYTDMGMSADIFRGSHSVPTITAGGNTGARNPDLVTLTTYAHGAVWTYYANESTPIAVPSANNNSVIQLDAGHADSRFQASNVVGGSMSFGYNTGTTYANQNSVGIAIGNPSNAQSKTQTAKAAILGVVAKTQPATARIGQLKTKAQTATARIAQSFTKLQTAISRVGNIRTRTQPATAHLTANVTRTITAKAMLVAAGHYTITATARIFTSYMDSQRPPSWSEANPGGDSDFTPAPGGGSEWTPAHPGGQADYR